MQKYNFKRKELSPDDQIRVLHEAYQFLLKKHKLGEDPRNPRSPHGSSTESDQPKKNALVSPFMKLSIEKEEVEDEEGQQEEDKNASDNESEIFDDDVFALEKAVDSALDSTSPQPSASEQEMARNFKRKPNSIKGAPTKKPSLKRQKVLLLKIPTSGNQFKIWI